MLLALQKSRPVRLELEEPSLYHKNADIKHVKCTRAKKDSRYIDLIPSY